MAIRPAEKGAKPYVVISGLPGSGKSTLARGLAPLLNLPVIDKDDSLKRLFETRGIGDAAWRRALSRESDQLFQKQAFQTQGAILVSFWHLPGMAPDSGTPTEWLGRLSTHMVNLACVCAPEIAADRCFRRTRHPGHLDGAVSRERLLASIQSVSRLDRLEIGRRIDVDTSTEHINFDTLAKEILSALIV
jgi:hypothetical protein